MLTAVTFQGSLQASIVNTKEELIKEINHYKAFWLTAIGNTYTNNKGVNIVITGLNEDTRKWLSNRMRG